ncbi:MAG: 23S rRNA (guanosine(2251)-2'-O)-methyltransferase RlmB [Clostridia bacterium]|nr:23S rRNA (guanosine(2251)-2'-O)-methyltransferase RlmB [Clostridia bacterium]
MFDKDINLKEEKKFGEDIIAGRNAVTEAMRSGRAIDSIYVQKGNRHGSITAIISKARDKGINIKEADIRKLDRMCGGANHQGICAVAAAAEYSEMEDIFRLAEERCEPPFVIICDELSDPHNLGAIIRTAECAGAHGVIVPKRRSAGLTYAVGKSSAGAVEYVPVVRVSNLPATIDELKERGLWVYAADMDGTNWCEQDYSGPVALVVGSEGEGVGRLIKEKCDFVISLPMKGRINSLNASVACGVICYEVSRQRSSFRAINK